MNFVIPDNAIKYILFQRTANLVFADMLVFRAARKFMPFLSYEAMVAIESKLRPNGIRKRYLEEMQREYLSVESHLPAGCNQILDIGCGVAGIDMFLNAHYAGNPPDFYLLDKTQMAPKVYYMFEARGAFYNSLAVAQNLLAANGIEPGNIHLLEATDHHDIDIPAKIDLAISLVSWGFHYPVDLYLEQVHGLLVTGGVVIMDIRKETDGLDLLSSRFGGITVIADTAKYHRVSAVKT